VKNLTKMMQRFRKHAKGGVQSKNNEVEGHVVSKDKQPIELGILSYANLTPDGKHGDFASALKQSQTSGKPIFANFVEWPGCAGVVDAGKYIFAEPSIARLIQTHFVPVAFNTWDRNDCGYNQAMKAWGGPLARSDWGYVRIIATDGRTILASTPAVTGRNSKPQVQAAIREALQKFAEHD
jgi:hypothetical protein